jgi:two-component system, chemotaxis family, protein-glutamate methylesterase/glutaminase
LANIIVIGGSAGAIKPLRQIVRDLDPEIQAAIFAVVHIPAAAPSLLPEVLNARGHVRVKHARDGEKIAASCVYVAPPDRHLMLLPGRIQLLRGPQENRHRPAIDPLFRTAAKAYGKRVIAVLLSGLLDDGSVGLGIVKAAGGVAIVEDPREAEFSMMPAAAIQRATPDFVLPAAQISKKIQELIRDPWPTDLSTTRSTGPEESARKEMVCYREANKWPTLGI